LVSCKLVQAKCLHLRKLKDNELAALITYIRNAPELGNKVGDEIQPKAITPVYDDE
jgi:cytochrome c oxidase subunit II